MAGLIGRRSGRARGGSAVACGRGAERKGGRRWGPAAGKAWIAADLSPMPARCWPPRRLKSGGKSRRTGRLGAADGPPASLNPYRELAAIAAEAERLGLSVPRVSAGVTGGTDFDKLMPAIVDFLDNIQASAKTSTASAAEVEALLDRASALLQALNRAERSPPDRDPTSGAGAATVARPAFAELTPGLRRALRQLQHPRAAYRRRQMVRGQAQR